MNVLRDQCRSLSRVVLLMGALVPLACGSEPSEQGPREPSAATQAEPASPYLVVLGTAQDGGTPQIGGWDHPAWTAAALER